ncbi:MAG: MFS transporter [Eubacterium sp.]|nr:MFS transporter [Eubacterium sp.]
MKKSYKNKHGLSKKETLIYGIANGGQVFGYSLVTSYLMYFYLNVFQVNAKIISAVFLIGGIWDIINNPLIGMMIDHKNNALGKQTEIIRHFTPLQCMVTILIFMGPIFIKSNSDTSLSKIIYLVLTYFLWEFFYSVTDVAFGGLVAVISPKPKDRQKAISVSNICNQLSASLVVIAIPIMLDISKSGKTGISLEWVFVIMGLLAGIIGVGLFSLSGYFVKERITQTKEKQSINEILHCVIHNKPLLLLLLSNLITSLSGIGEAFSTYYYLDVLGYASMSIIVAAPAFVISIFSYSLIKFGKRFFNNKHLFILSNLGAAAAQLILFFIGLNHYANLKVMLPSMIICNCIVALFAGVLNTLPTEMLTEATDYAEWKTGIRAEGIAFSLKISVVKVYGTLAQGFAVFLLSIIGYVSATSAQAVVQTDTVQQRIWIVYSIIPVIVRIVSSIPVFFYNIVGEERARMFNELKIKRNGPI